LPEMNVKDVLIENCVLEAKLKSVVTEGTNIVIKNTKY
jgi:hypothetical protein